MEKHLDASMRAVRALEAALSEYEKTRVDLDALGEYYGSSLWMADFEDDEAGRLPDGLKRGVLSEDAVYDLLAADRELKDRMLRLSTGENAEDVSLPANC